MLKTVFRGLKNNLYFELFVNVVCLENRKQKTETNMASVLKTETKHTNKHGTIEKS
jgi:hypothetical protein